MGAFRDRASDGSFSPPCSLREDAAAFTERAARWRAVEMFFPAIAAIRAYFVVESMIFSSAGRWSAAHGIGPAGLLKLLARTGSAGGVAVGFRPPPTVALPGADWAEGRALRSGKPTGT